MGMVKFQCQKYVLEQNMVFYEFAGCSGVFDLMGENQNSTLAKGMSIQMSGHSVSNACPIHMLVCPVLLMQRHIGI